MPPPEQSAGHRALLAPEHPDVEADEQQHRRERDQQVGQEAALLDQRRRPHGRAARRQFGQQIVARERRPLGGELLIGAILLAGNGDGLLQLAFDGVAAGKHLADVLVGDLGLELGVRHRLRSGQSVLDRQHAKQHQVADQPRPPS